MIVDQRIGITYGSVLYNGGDLNQSDFQVVSYSNQGIEINPEALIVISRPSLTPLEAEVLAQVPSTASEIHLSEVPEAWPVLVARVAFIVFQVAAAWGASAHGRAYDAAREWAADADRADLNRHIAQEYLAAADVNRLGIQEAAQAVQRAFDAQRLMQGVAMLDVDREHFVRAVPAQGVGVERLAAIDQQMVDRVANAARAGADLAVANRLAAFQAALDRRAAYVAQGGYRPRMSEAIDVDQELFRTALPSLVLED
jgi:hypothetical protein